MKAHEETRGPVSIVIEHDMNRELSDAVCCDPVLIFGREHGLDWQVLDTSRRRFPDTALMRALADRDYVEILANLCDMSLSGWGVTSNGRIWAEHGDWPRRRYFKTAAETARALFRSEYGAELADLKVEQFGDCRSTFYLCFWQSELDEYAGGKGVPSCLASCQAIVDGEVYGFRVRDEDGDVLDACGGFIGAMEYCLEEARASADWHAAEIHETRAAIQAAAIQAARPDLAPQWCDA